MAVFRAASILCLFASLFQLLLFMPAIASSLPRQNYLVRISVSETGETALVWLEGSGPWTAPKGALPISTFSSWYACATNYEQ